MNAVTATETPEIKAPPGRRVPLLADAPLGDPKLDRFGFAEFAHALCLIVDDPDTATPLTIAVSAPWGGGKSSLGCMLQTMLDERVRNREGDDPRLVVWFNAWEHDDAPHLGAALAASVARAADRNRHWWRRALAPLPGAMLRPGERSRQTVLIALVSALVAVALAFVGPARDLTEQILGQPDIPATGAGVLGIVFFSLFASRRLFTVAREAARFVDDPRSAAATGSMTDVKAQFGRLIRHATHEGRLVIIVDDLERCAADRALEVCQVASQVLAHPGVVTIVLADMEPIARSAGERYAASMPEGEPDDAEEIGRRYLAKIVQLEIALPPPVPEDMRRVIREYGPSLRQPRQKAAQRSLRGRVARLRLSELWRGVGRVVLRVRWWPILVWFVGFVLFYPAEVAESEEWRVHDTVLWLSLVVAIGLGIWSRRLRKRQRRLREDLRTQIQELKDQQLSPEEVQREVKQSAAVAPERSALIKDLVSSSFLDSDEFRAVEAFIVENPPALPREAKRSFNHAQLLTEIARARHMFGGTPVLTPAHLAKWLVLREQWPAVARAVTHRPEVLCDLERDAREQDPELTELLASEPHLGDVIARLVYFQPADGRRDPA
ncbi:MAG TPA: P-loop NTPase fold protein [Solirubrobacteraceae bacterium]|nr:P-loop NTPase fold protein [Solirubrobacteraceae bacterium]